MDALTLAGTDYTNLAIVMGVAAVVAASLTQLVKITARAKVQESGGSSKRPWWWAMSLRTLSAPSWRLFWSLYRWVKLRPLERSVGYSAQPSRGSSSRSLRSAESRSRTGIR